MNRFHKFGRFSLVSIALAVLILSGCPKKKASQKIKTRANENVAGNSTTSKKIENPRKKDSANRKEALRKEADRRSLNEVQKRLVKFYKNLQSMRADVTLIRYNDQLKKSDKPAVGKASFLPKTSKRMMYVRLDWVRPTPESLVIVGNEYGLYRPYLSTAYQGKLNTPKLGNRSTGPLGFLNMSLSEIKQEFIPDYVGKEKLNDGVQTHHITVTPSSATTFYSKADVWIDLDGCPRQVKVTERNGDASTVELSNIEKNVAVKAEIFRLRFPKGTMIVKG